MGASTQTEALIDRSGAGTMAGATPEEMIGVAIAAARGSDAALETVLEALPVPIYYRRQRLGHLLQSRLHRFRRPRATRRPGSLVRDLAALHGERRLRSP